MLAKLTPGRLSRCCLVAETSRVVRVFKHNLRKRQKLRPCIPNLNSNVQVGIRVGTSFLRFSKFDFNIIFLKFLESSELNKFRIFGIFGKFRNPCFWPQNPNFCLKNRIFWPKNRGFWPKLISEPFGKFRLLQGLNKNVALFVYSVFVLFQCCLSVSA